jgi:hypothetical protein
VDQYQFIHCPANRRDRLAINLSITVDQTGVRPETGADIANFSGIRHRAGQRPLEPLQRPGSARSRQDDLATATAYALGAVEHHIERCRVNACSGHQRPLDQI